MTGRIRRINPERYYATDASRQTLTVAALDRGHGYQKRRNPASLQELNDTDGWIPDLAESESSYLGTLADLWLLAHETRSAMRDGRS